MDIYLKEMSEDMFHIFFKKYSNDRALYLNTDDYYEYVYSTDRVNEYIQRQKDKKRIVLAIMCDDIIAGEIKIYNIIDHESCMFGITLVNDDYKGKGIGTKAEQLLIDYVFDVLDIPVIYADSIITNKRSQHVLEKVGFKRISSDDQYIYYQIERK